MTCEQCGDPLTSLDQSRFCSRAYYGRWMFEQRGDLATRLIESCKLGRADECWPWEGRWHGRYGQLDYSGERWLAHRASFHAFVGDIPIGNVVMHTCDNGACINPHHLLTGEQADNVADMIAKGRAAWQDEDIEILVALAAEHRRAPLAWGGER